MRKIHLTDFAAPFASGFTTRVNQTTTWVRAKPSWLIRVLAFGAIILGVALFFVVLLPLALLAIVVFILVDAFLRVRGFVASLFTRGDAVPPDNSGRRNVRVREPK